MNPIAMAVVGIDTLFGVDNLEPTENDDLIVKASTTDPHNQGALIFDNSDGDTRAVVEMWNPSYWVVDGGTGKKTKYWSYVAVPIQEADIPNFFWYGFTYLYDETSGWIKKSDGTSLYPFQGIGASLQEGNMETFYGPLATTESQDITLTYNLPQNLLKKAYISNAKVYCSLKNFITFNRLNDNYDPERGGAITFPLQKQVVIGLNLGF